MTKFADQYSTIYAGARAGAGPRQAAGGPAAARRGGAGSCWLAGAGGVAVAAAAAGVLVAGGGTPAYAVTTHPNGTVTLAVTKTSGISGANAALRKLGDRVVVVPVEPGCPSLGSLPAPPCR